jgi:hypothetical protein
MMQLLVEDAQAWWKHIGGADFGSNVLRLSATSWSLVCAMSGFSGCRCAAALNL